MTSEESLKEAIFEIMHNEGVSKVGALIDAGIENDLIKKAGSWFSYKEKNLAQGKEQLRKLLREDESLRDSIAQELESIIYPKDEAEIKQ